MPVNIKSNELVFWWDKFDVLPNEYSIPSFYTQNFLILREELIDFVYELGLKKIDGTALQDYLFGGDRLSMWWCSLIFEKHPMLTPNFYEVLKLRSLEQMLKKYAPHCSEIILHGHGFRFSNTLRSFCSKLNISFSVVKNKNSSKAKSFNNFLKSSYKKLLPEIRAIIRFLYWFFSVRIFLRQAKADSLAAGITMLSYYPHIEKSITEQRFTSPYWGALQANLVQQKKVNWLFMRINSSRCVFKQAIKKLLQFNMQKQDGFSFHFVEQFLPPKQILQAILRYIKLAYAARKLENHVKQLCYFPKSNINFWLYLKPYFKESFRGWICLERALQRNAMLEYARIAPTQELTLFPMENCPWERMLTEAMHYTKHGKVYGAQHSVLRQSDLRYFDCINFYNNFGSVIPDKILVNSAHAYKQLCETTMPRHKFYIVEALRYMHLLKYTKPKLYVQKSKNILVVTSFFEQAARAHIKLLAKLLQQSKDALNLHIVIKAHPYCSIDKMVQKYILPKYAVNITTKNIDILLSEFTANNGIVWACNDTSVSVEAIYAGLPVLIQKAHGFDLCPLQGIDALKYVYTYNDVQSFLDLPQKIQVPSQFFKLDARLTRWYNLLDLKE